MRYNKNTPGIKSSSPRGTAALCSDLTPLLHWLQTFPANSSLVEENYPALTWHRLSVSLPTLSSRVPWGTPRLCLVVLNTKARCPNRHSRDANLSSFLRLVQTTGICSLPSSDWFRLQEYALFPPPSGSDYRRRAQWRRQEDASRLDRSVRLGP
eukprot:1852104-Pyramimonas_sp.AAC.1